MDAEPIAIPEMASHLAAGAAVALLPEGVPGPVRLADQWWAVPAGADHYRPVTDPVAVTAFDTALARLAAHRRHRTEIVARTGARRR